MNNTRHLLPLLFATLAHAQSPPTLRVVAGGWAQIKVSRDSPC